jgi:hypothetical protein
MESEMEIVEMKFLCIAGYTMGQEVTITKIMEELKFLI